MEFKFHQQLDRDRYRFVITSEFHNKFETNLKMATLDLNNKKTLAKCLKNASKQNRDIGKTSSQKTLYLLVYRKFSFKYRSFYFYNLISTKTILIILFNNYVLCWITFDLDPLENIQPMHHRSLISSVASRLGFINIILI